MIKLLLLLSLSFYAVADETAAPNLKCKFAVNDTGEDITLYFNEKDGVKTFTAVTIEDGQSYPGTYPCRTATDAEIRKALFIPEDQELPPKGFFSHNFACAENLDEGALELIVLARPVSESNYVGGYFVTGLAAELEINCTVNEEL